MDINAINRLKAMLVPTQEQAGSWGFKPLETDGSASTFDLILEKFEKLLVYAEKQAIRSFQHPDTNEFNVMPSGAGFVVFMMQHNTIMSNTLKSAVLKWANAEMKDPESKAALRRRIKEFATAVKKYKPIVRRDLGVYLESLEMISEDRLSSDKE